jgi:hypothetical protein
MPAMIRRFALAALLATAFAALGSDLAAQGSKRVPRFEDYPVKEIYQGKSAPLVFETNEQRDSVIYYQAIADGGTNFAGHYAVATLSCGTGCIAADILDLRTGKLTSVPFENSGWTEAHDRFREIEFRRASRLIVFAGRIDDKGPTGWHFFVFNNGKLNRVHTLVTKDFRKPLAEWMK